MNSNKNENKISALLITYNEAHHIKQVIENIAFANEIIVIDSFSNDGTLEMLSELKNVKVISREFNNFADQRNFAISQAKYPWLLFIDADERITPKLQLEILETIGSNNKTAGYMFKRSYYFKNKRIYFSGHQSDTTYRLFKNGKVTYDETKVVHETPIIDGSSAVLKNEMKHYSFTTYNHLKRKMEIYGKLKARELFIKNEGNNAFNFIIKPLYKFLFNYVIRLGILDGKEGFIICYLNAYSVYCRYKELRQLNLKAS
jgi:glycosyltransferase involved in cell wall biosynthesis